MKGKTGRMTSRRVYEELKGHVDPRLLFVIAALAEDNSEHRQELRMMAEQLDQMANLMGNFVQIAGNMTDRLRKLRLDDLDDDPYIQAKKPEA